MILVIIVSILSYITFCYIFVARINSLMSVGPLYLITRDNATLKSPILSLGFMRQTSSPWKIGKGLQLRISRYSIQVGLCKKSNNQDEQSGLLHAMGGRLLELNGSEIGKW